MANSINNMLTIAASLLFAVSHAQTEASCNAVSYTSDTLTNSVPTNVCNPANAPGTAGYTSFAYYCKDGEARSALYSSGDCSGTPVTNTAEFQTGSSDVVATCDKSACANVVSVTAVSPGCVAGSDLTEDMTYLTLSYIADECVPSTTTSIKWTCSSGTATQMTYLNGDCSGYASQNSTYTADGKMEICSEFGIGTRVVCGSASLTVTEGSSAGRIGGFLGIAVAFLMSL